jgi:hypothetical protein
MNFKQFMKLMEYANVGGGALLPTSWTGSSAPDTMSMGGRPLSLPGNDLGLPSVQRSGRIDILIKDKNPIYVQLSDGSKLFFSLDEFKRIKGFPEVGRNMTVIFQRAPSDLSLNVSQVQSVQVS